MATTDPAMAYVKFYLKVLGDLDSVAEGLLASARSTQEAIGPFADAINGAEGIGGELSALSGTEGLWRPSDPENLSGLCDVFEVVGRFTFQGEDDQNLSALSQKVEGLRAEIARQRGSLALLAKVPTQAGVRADSLDAQDQASARAHRAKLMEQFDPEAKQLKELCTRLLEAIRAVRRPELSRIETADTLYLDYVQRVRGLYGRALPFMRSSLSEISKIAGCEVPPSWPEVLPFAQALPKELLTPPQAESPELAQMRQNAEAVAAHEAAMQRAIDELGVQIRRVEGEMVAQTAKESEALKEENAAKAILRWATRYEELDTIRSEITNLQHEGTSKMALISQVAAEVQRGVAAASTLHSEAGELAELNTAKEAALAKHRAEEPAFLGKGEWRRKLDEADNESEEARLFLNKKTQALQSANTELTRLRTREQLERAQVEGLSRRIDEARAREADAQREVSQIEQSLGASRPVKRLTTAQAEHSLAAIWTARNELRARIDRLSNDARRLKEDTDRAQVQQKQMAVERQKQQPVLTQVTQAATASQEEALRTLSARRQAGFESHASSVLAGLEESLSNVERVFIEPARRVLLERAGVGSVAPSALRAQAGELAATLPEISRQMESRLGAMSATLDQIGAEFIAKAPAACRGHWVSAV